MLPYLIAGAIGFVVGKLLEEDEAPKYLNDEGYLPGHIPEEIFNDFKKYVKEILLF